MITGFKSSKRERVGRAFNRLPPAPPTEAERAKRQSDLLDEALEETFPASDPVSVIRI